MIQLDQLKSARPEEVEAVVQSYPVKATVEPRRWASLKASESPEIVRISKVPSLQEKDRISMNI